MNKVLIIDDSSTVRRLVSNCVRALGGDIVGLAEDGDEGIEKFKTLKPDIVLLDITMPNKDGRECLKEIMAIDSTAFVVMLSAVGSEEVKTECFTMGAKAFLDKQVNMESALNQAIGARLRSERDGGDR
jgi:two-component system chemotaxis response regulator CheY